MLWDYINEWEDMKTVLKTRTLGKSGIAVTEIGMSLWAAGGDQWGPTDDRTVLDAIEYALNVGVTFFDTADVYGAGHSEELLGLPCAGAVTDLSWRARSAGRTLTPSVADCVPQRGEVHH